MDDTKHYNLAVPWCTFDNTLPMSTYMNQLLTMIHQGDNDGIDATLRRHCCQTRDAAMVAIGLEDKSTSSIEPMMASPMMAKRYNHLSLLSMDRSIVHHIVSFVSPTSYLWLDQPIHYGDGDATTPHDSYLSISLSLQGGTALSMASLLGFSHIVAMLIGAGATVDSTTDECVTPLMLACHRCNIATVMVLLEAGAKVNSKESIQGRQPIHFAVMCDTPGRGMNVIEALIQHGGDIDARDAHYKTALIIASEWNKVDILKYLIKAGAGINLHTDSYYTAIECAALALHFECIKALLDAGAET